MNGLFFEDSDRRSLLWNQVARLGIEHENREIHNKILDGRAEVYLGPEASQPIRETMS